MEKRKRPERNKYQTDYKTEHYYRLVGLLPIGYKDIVKPRADELGLSLTQYIKSLIDADCGITDDNVESPQT